MVPYFLLFLPALFLGEVGYQVQTPPQNEQLEQVGPEVYEMGNDYMIEGEQDINRGHDYLDKDHPLQEAPLPEGMVE